MIRLLLICSLFLPWSASAKTMEEGKEAYKAENFAMAAEVFESIFAENGTGDALFMAGAARLAAGHLAHAIHHVEKWKTLADRRPELNAKAEVLLGQANKATFAVKVLLPPDLVRDRKQPLKIRFTRNDVPALEWPVDLGWDAKPTEVRLDKGDWVAEVDVQGYRPSPLLQVIEEDSVITLLPEVAQSLLGDGVPIAVRLGFQEAIELFRGTRYADAVKSCDQLLSEVPNVEEIEWLRARALHLAGMKGHAFNAYSRFAARYPQASDIASIRGAIDGLKANADAEQATVTLHSSPPGGSVALAEMDEVKGQTPVVLKLYPGRYTLTVRLEGHDTVHQVFEVEPKGVQTIEANLVRPPDPNHWRFGGVVGVGFGQPAKFDHSTITADGGIRSGVGAFVERRLRGRYSVRTEIRYTLDKLSVSDTEKASVNWTRHALSIPLLAQVKVFEGVSIVVGPSAEIGLAGSEVVDGEEAKDIEFAPLVWVGELGVGYALPGDIAPLRMDLRLSRTLTSLLGSADQGLVLGHLRGGLDVSWAF